MPKSISISATSRPCGFAAGVERHSRRWSCWSSAWEREVAPHLAAANVEDLDALAAKVEEARALDASIVAKDAELESLRVQIASLAGSADSLREASERATTAVPRSEMFLSTRSPRILRRSARTRPMRCESGDSSCPRTWRPRATWRARPERLTRSRKSAAGARRRRWTRRSSRGMRHWRHSRRSDG